jgi:hypothetical protein
VRRDRFAAAERVMAYMNSRSARTTASIPTHSPVGSATARPGSIEA